MVFGREAFALVVACALTLPATSATASTRVTPAVAAFGSASSSVLTADGAFPLHELPGTPLVANFEGRDLNFSTNNLFSSAAVADVTGDGNPDIVVGGMNSVARVYNMSQGLVLALDPGGADPATGHGATQASPAIGDMDGDGTADVVIANTGGRLAAYSVKGNVVREIYNRYVEPAYNGAAVGLFGTPALGLIDHDTRLDAVTSSWGQTLDSFSGPTGEPLSYMRFWLKDTIWSSPVLGDVDGDGENEIVVGGDCEGSGTLQPCYDGAGRHGGYVWAYNLDGTLQWSYFVDGAVVWSTPALIDLDGDAALDVVVGTGLFYLDPAANKIMAINGRTGQLMWTGQTPGPVMGSPAVALVDGQPRIWVVGLGGTLTSWSAAGDQLWQICMADQPCSGGGLGTFGGVAIADINNDGILDAVTQGEEYLRVFRADNGAVESAVRTRYPHRQFAGSATPTIASVGGETWIVQPNFGDANDNSAPDGGDDLVVTVWTTGTPLGSAPWPTFKADMARTGGRALTTPPTSSPVIAPPPSVAVPRSKPSVTVITKAKKSATTLSVNVNPNLVKRGYWTFRVQKLAADGVTWKSKKAYRTSGPKETRTINLPKGTYRVVVSAKNGYARTTSGSATLKR